MRSFIRNCIEAGVAVIVVVILACNVGCAATPTVSIRAPDAADQAQANQKVQDDAADAAKMYRDRMRAYFCAP